MITHLCRHAPPKINSATPVHGFTGLNFGDYYITVVDANGVNLES
jgi:hypothetical protein